MEVQRVIGLRRAVRFLDPDRPVERGKIQKMLEAARRAPHWGNVQTLRAVVIERATASREILGALEARVGGYQVRIAPVVIVWYLDASAVDEQPERLHEIVDARAMGIRYEETKAYLDKVLIPFFAGLKDRLKRPGLSEVDCGQGIANAALVAFDLGLGACLVGGANLDRLAEQLRLPPEGRVLLLQTIGYPAEDVEGAGQRPRLPFERLYSLNWVGQPFPRDPQVVKELEESGLIRPVGPDDRQRRDRELEALAEKYDLPPY